MSEGLIRKPEKDYSKQADKEIPEAETLAKNDVHGALEKLLDLEKHTRQASDLASTTRVMLAIVNICRDAKDWSLLNEQVLLLSKKHGQFKQAVTKMVQVVMGLLDETPDLDTKLSVIETIRTVTDGKIYVEVERARVTRILSNIRKSQGKNKEAADILCELQVETFGSMDRRERTEFILDQVSLCMENRDFTQALVLSRKIGTKYFARRAKKTPEQLAKEKKQREEEARRTGEEEAPTPVEDDVTDLKLRYYEQQIELSKNENQYMEVCKHYRRVLDTPAVEDTPALLSATLQRIIYFVLLAPHDNEQSDLLHRVNAEVRNSSVPLDAQLLKLFTIPELMRWPIVAQKFGPHLCSSDIFDVEKNEASPKAYERWQDLRKRVIEHNVRVVAKYYTRVHLARLTQLLDLDEHETEVYISKMVTDKTIYARIDRPAKIVTFAKPSNPDDVLNEWSSSMKSLLGLLERVDHLITKEEMMARIQPSRIPKRAKAEKAR
ncbi:MAG: hypothetical protein M1825_004817 [Sarcosagium campestre]|nr:MAG: hypothetical protein M1825_004817 [Sarcosagium campestre]